MFVAIEFLLLSSIKMLQSGICRHWEITKLKVKKYYFHINVYSMHNATHILKVFRLTTLLSRIPTYPTKQYQVWSAIDTPERFIPSLTHGRTHARYR